MKRHDDRLWTPFTFPKEVERPAFKYYVGRVMIYVAGVRSGHGERTRYCSHHHLSHAGAKNCAKKMENRANAETIFAAHGYLPAGHNVYKGRQYNVSAQTVKAMARDGVGVLVLSNEGGVALRKEN